MPATFPSHPGFVLPLKLWRPRWFDGVALGVGASAPDLAYLVNGSGLPVWPLSHEPLGLLVWCLPVTVVVAWVLRRAAPVVAVHLPSTQLCLRDYGALRYNPHRWFVTTSSAVVGGASHLATDSLGARVPFAELALHLVGVLMLLLTMRHVAEHALIRRWHGLPPVVPRQPGLFWWTALVLATAGAVITPYLPGAELSHTTGVRLLAVAVGALVGAAVCTACATRVRAAGWIS